MARSIAAGGGASAEAPDDVMAEMTDAGTPQPTGPVPMEQIESALSTLEGALEGLPPDKQAKIRTHLDAIRTVVSDAEAAGEGEDSAATEPPPPSPDQQAAGDGMTEKLSGLA